MQNYKLVIPDPFLRLQVIQQIEDNNLPVADLDENKLLFALINDQQQLVGTAGLEIAGTTALLRSVSIKKELQGQGLGKLITRELEKVAIAKGIHTLYLLTTTASNFFQKHRYTVVDRGDVPVSIKESSEFSSICPSTATVMKKELSPRKKVLFVCIENSNRSQMSQAFAKMIGGGEVEAYSAGSKPYGIVNPKAIAAMKELGYDLSIHDSKSLDEVKQFAPFDAVVTMGCGDACPWMPAKKFIDWEIPDPKQMEPAEFNKVRDYIKEKVTDLIASLKEG